MDQALLYQIQPRKDPKAKLINEFPKEERERLVYLVPTLKTIILSGNSYSKDFCQDLASIIKDAN